jgi:uncharacterized protein with ATP-grasp and redox domains
MPTVVVVDVLVLDEEVVEDNEVDVVFVVTGGPYVIPTVVEDVLDAEVVDIEVVEVLEGRVVVVPTGP